jgi:hypothetical protein
MKRAAFAAVVAACLFAALPARAADSWLERLAMCQDSWLDWKNDPVQTKKLGESFNAAFEQKPSGGSWAPRARILVAGLPVVEAIPESVGMGVGFSVIVDAPFATARAQVEKALGKTLKPCEFGDGMRTCALELSAKRTVTVMAPVVPEKGAKATTLVGCFYYYEK